MPRKPTSGRPTPGRASRSASSARPEPAPTLASLRSQIDKLDLELVGLLNRRAEIAAADRPGQEAARARDLVVGPRGRSDRPASWPRARARSPPDTLRLIFRELMSGSRALQKTLRVAYLGPKYSYSHLACGRQVRRGRRARPGRLDRRGLRGGQPPARPVRHRAAGELDRRPDRRHAGHVRPAAGHQDPRRGPAAGPPLPARRAASGARSAGSTPRRRRCRSAGTGWARTCRRRTVARRGLDGRRRRAGPARGVRRRRGQPGRAARRYGLNVLAANIEDQPHNETRFAVIAEQRRARTGHDKTTLMFRLPNQAGSLAKAIAPFEKNEVNLTWIESFPASDSHSDRDPTYLFFVDFEGHAEDEPVQSRPGGRPQALRAPGGPRLLPARRVHRELSVIVARAARAVSDVGEIAARCGTRFAPVLRSLKCDVHPRDSVGPRRRNRRTGRRVPEPRERR